MTNEPHDRQDPQDGYGGSGYTDAGYPADGAAGYGGRGYGGTGYDDPVYGDPGHQARGTGYDAYGGPYEPSGHDAVAYGAQAHGGGEQSRDAHGYHPEPAPGGWAGEYDADATAFVQLPGPGSGWPGADPLAAPGTGQGGYTPPTLSDFEPGGPPAYGAHTPSGGHGGQAGHGGGLPGPTEAAPGGAPMTPAATTDPSSTGQWTLPFAAPADPSNPVPASDTAPGPVPVGDPGPHGETAALQDATAPSAPQSVTGMAAAMGQGAAAALAGSHEARIRRPLGAGGAAGRVGEEPGEGDSMASPAAEAAGVPQQGAPHRTPGEGASGTVPGPRHGGPDRQPQTADALARRQVPFAAAPAGGEEVSWPEPGAVPAPRAAHEQGGGPGADPGGEVPSQLPGGPGGPHEEAVPTVSPSSAIPYADSTPGAHASEPSHRDDLAPGRPPAAEDTGDAGGPESGALATPSGDGPLPAAPAPFPGGVAEGAPWRGADAEPPAGPPAPADPASAEPPASAGAPPPSRTRGGEGSPPSKIPFVASTPGAPAETPPAPSAPAEGEPDRPAVASAGEGRADGPPPGTPPADAPPPGAPSGGEGFAPADTATGPRDQGHPGAAPGGDGWAGTPSGPGPDDSGEYVTTPAAAPAGEADPAGTDPPDSYTGRTEAIPDGSGPQPVGPVHSDHPHVSYVLQVNGVDRPVSGAWIGESLLYVLRERLGLAGAKDGCSQGECGACSVQVDGRLVASCLVPAATAAGSEVRTVEGLAEGGAPSDVQRALADCGAVQCGYCVPGLAMAVHELLEGNHAPTELETRQAICGNLCRCSGYRGVLDAVESVVSERAAQAAQSSPEGDQAS